MALVWVLILLYMARMQSTSKKFFFFFMRFILMDYVSR